MSQKFCSDFFGRWESEQPGKYLFSSQNFEFDIVFPTKQKVFFNNW